MDQRLTRLLGPRVLAVCAIVALGAVGPVAAPPAASTVGSLGAATRTSGYVGAWSASPQPPTPPGLSAPGDLSSRGFRDQTVRQTVHTSGGGTSVIVRFSNRFGTRPVRLGSVTVGLSAGSGQVVAGTLSTVTFGGSGTATITRGADLYSDPVAFSTPAGSDLVVSTYLPGSTGPATYHALSRQTNFVGVGDRTRQSGAAGFGSPTSSWYFLSGVDVRGGARASVVTVGDSITDGYASTADANNRWPDYLAQRLNARPGNTLAVVNQAISGNRVLEDSPCFGTNLLSRLERDVLGQAGARTVILLEGINDIGFSQAPNAGCAAPNTAVSAAQIIAGYRQIVLRAHLRGLRVLGGTLTPFQGADTWSPAAEKKREKVNSAIRTPGLFDGVIDFDAAVRDPSRPTRLAPGYDSGDHLHPDDAGYAAMAAAVDLTQLVVSPAPRTPVSGRP